MWRPPHRESKQLSERSSIERGKGLENYVIRIYRLKERLAKSRRKVVGIVEEPGVESNKVFYDMDGLSGLLRLHAPGGAAKNDLKKPSREALRFRLNLPAAVSGTTVNGVRFSEETVIADLGSGGAFLSIGVPVPVGSLLYLTIDPEKSDLKIAARVVRVVGRAGKIGVGVSFERNTGTYRNAGEPALKSNNA